MKVGNNRSFGIKIKIDNNIAAKNKIDFTQKGNPVTVEKVKIADLVTI